jgi:proton-dependent oligopeptide transporter, POT family
MSTASHNSETTIFGHKPGLFLLFFTEMWERFSYYGMRVLLVLFLVSETAGGGWGWTRSSALNLYALYTGLVYVTPILGGIIADKFLGYRKAVIVGAFLMTLGHVSLALETTTTFYAGLVLLILGNGFFKPNISSIVGQLYANDGGRKDSAYTIFYMGINAGAFLGILLCGYIGEKTQWSYGFGLAGVFMFLGMIMFQLGQGIFGDLGLYSKPTKHEVKTDGTEESPAVVRDRLIVIGILSFFTIFFWVAFEQAGGSMNIFAKDYTRRILTGSAATVFFWVNAMLTIVPLAIVTWVLVRLVAVTKSRIPMSNLSISISFVIIWAIALWMLNKEYNMRAFDITIVPPAAAEGAGAVSGNNTESDAVAADAAEDKNAVEVTDAVQGENTVAAVEVKDDALALIATTIQTDVVLKEGQTIHVVDIEGKGGNGKLRILTDEQAATYTTDLDATVVREKQNETEVTASWFQILNSFFIIAFAPLFSRMWASRFNPSAPVKFGIGLILLGMGFGALALASQGIAQGATTAQVSMWWLIVAFLFHTLGELFVSPVGLSYVSKLAPAKLVGLMFGIWFLASAIANYLAGFSGSYIDAISEKYGLTTFFLIYTLIPIIAGVAILTLTGKIKKLMHGIE